MFGSGISIVNEQPKLDNIELGGSSYGKDIIIAYGTNRLPANLVFAGKVNAHRVEDRQDIGGKGGGGGTITNISWTYSTTLGYTLQAGPVAGLRRL